MASPRNPSESERIFHEALERGTQAERSAYLDGACGADAGLRQRVDALLEAHAEAEEFLEQPVLNPQEANLQEGPGSVIGDYKLLQRIGEGGMGAVYMAEQERPVRRKVALKIIKLGMDTKQVIARFEAERQALALMDHPNIAKVLGAGATDSGRPYFVMELVRGVSISEYCDTHNLPMRSRLELFVEVCHAIQHAHQKGIIHRDIKPNNVLVTSHDGRPVPKIIDFGVAKATNQRLTEQTLFTEFQQFIGTPEYMSPEQAEMSGLDIDTRSDIYSLGVLLYHLLTGRTPVDARTLRKAGYQGMQKLIREKEATAPSTMISRMGDASTEVARHRGTQPRTLESLFRGDLDWIVMKSLEKDRTRRYETASALADDIARHLTNQPVLAGRPSAVYKLNKFVRRNRVGVLAGTVAITAILIGLAAAVTGFVRARQEADRSQRISDTLQDLLVSVDPGQAASLAVDVEALLAQARDAFGDTHATIAATVNSLAVQLMNGGDFAGAEPLFRESVRVWSEIHGRDHLNVAVTLGRLGAVLRAQGKMTEAEQTLRESLSILESLPDAPPVAASPILIELAQLLGGRGARAETDALYRRAVQSYQTDADRYRFLLLETLEAYLSFLLSGEDSESTLAAFRTLYDEVRRAYPEGGVYHVATAVGLGNWLYQIGRPVEAEPYLREVLEILEARPEDPTYFRTMAVDRLFQILRARQDPASQEEADRLLARAIELLAPSWGAEELLSNYDILGDRLRNRDQYGQAIVPTLRAWQLSREAGMDGRTISTLGNRVSGTTVHAAILGDDPEEIYEEGLTAIEELQVQSPSESAYAIVTGALLYRLGRIDEAYELYGGIELIPNTNAAMVGPVKCAFHALMAHDLGEAEEADYYFDQMLERAAGRHGLNRRPLDQLIAEVRKALGR